MNGKLELRELQGQGQLQITSDADRPCEDKT